MGWNGAGGWGRRHGAEGNCPEQQCMPAHQNGSSKMFGKKLGTLQQWQQQHAHLTSRKMDTVPARAPAVRASGRDRWRLKARRPNGAAAASGNQQVHERCAGIRGVEPCKRAEKIWVCWAGVRLASWVGCSKAARLHDTSQPTRKHSAEELGCKNAGVDGNSLHPLQWRVHPR